jgi:copper homeostasis protein
MNRLLLEVIVQTVEDAREAARGGAHRLEVVRAIRNGGLTPPIDLVRAIAREVSLPLRVMVRENAGFTTDAAELESLRAACRDLYDAGVNGVVLGFAEHGRLRIDDVEDVLADTPRIWATFHRAFDASADPLSGLDEIARVPQIDRVLTRGGEGSADERARKLAELVGRAQGRLTIIAGGGVDEHALATFARTRCVSEVHVGRASRLGSDPNGPVSARLVERLRAICDGSP